MFLGLNTTSSYQLYLLTERTVINLLARVSRDVLESTRKAQIDGVTQSDGKVMVGMTNGNIMCFNIQTGDQVQLRSERLFKQNIIPNRQLFLES